MNEVLELTRINFPSAFIAMFAILFALKAIASLFEWMIDRLGLETKWMRKRREEQELLLQTSQKLSALQEKQKHDMEKSDQRDEEISSDIKKLTRMFVDKEIDDMRWEINNFATKVSEGKPCNKDSFQHCIHIYEKYEKILEDNGLENGEVNLSMELISDAYRQKLKNGF
ncbi:MAG: hypothetical protein OSJ69_01505 [Acetatifactor sp.]|nr:hypothetical protein [Acetatifactor sp.]